jgi:hypothetical protein
MADLVLVAHFLFVLFAVGGAFLLFVWPYLICVHLITVVWSSAVNLFEWTCPLTPIENRFRAAGGGLAYKGGCIEHYIGSLVYPLGMPRRLKLVAGFTILGWNALMYGFLILLRPGTITGG